MPTRARIVLPGIPLHVVHRGNNRQACFYQDSDRAFYLFHLRRLLVPASCSLHAYCLMTNHVHLLLTPAAGSSCAHLMQRVAQLHTQYVNRTYGRSGSLWEGRFRSCLVQAEDYLLACYRYVDANPVRAGLCAHPRDHEWSSYRFNAEGVPDDFLTPHDEYRRLGLISSTRRDAYAELFKSDPRYWRTDEIRKATNGNFALGNDTFRRSMAKALGRRVDEGKPGRPATALKNVVCP
jgi:putative transposase